MNRPLTICIDARVPHALVGGVQQFVIGLVAGLAALRDGDEEYVVLSDEGTTRWLPRLPAARWRLEHLAAAPSRPASAVKEFLSRATPQVVEMLSHVPLIYRAAPPPLPRASSAFERLDVDLVHFTTQSAFRTSVPSIYHPHDLQHLHLPRLFSPRATFLRERSYRAFCEQATMVAVASTWTRDDVVKQYGLPPDKVQVVPLAPVTETYSEPDPRAVEDLRRSRGLPRDFVFYPAQTWPHKNHIALLEALALLKRRGVVVPLVSSGHLNAHFAKIRRRAEQLGLASDAHFLGFVTPAELQCLYHACKAVVVPSLFEAASFPLWEAFLAGVPAACSNVTSLPRQAANSALVFDPMRVDEIAEAVRRLWTDDELRRELVANARRNVARFTWARTARLFRAHYRRLTGRGVTAADSALLGESPLL